MVDYQVIMTVLSPGERKEVRWRRAMVKVTATLVTMNQTQQNFGFSPAFFCGIY